ncbi:MAG: response regulator [candidate division Zixibacteria bacterium]|nr:response regulator [candidate division Zixibacteria bacterium]
MPNKILVADDSQTIRSVAEFLLRQKGYEVFLAQNGEEAFTLIKKISPDLVLLDNSMPLKDGFTLCQDLKNDYALKNIPVVMLLNSRESVNQEGFKTSGCESFILKPFSPREFLEKVEESLKKTEKTSQVKIEEMNLIKEPEAYPSGVDRVPESVQDKSVFEPRVEQFTSDEGEKITQPKIKQEDSYEKFVSEFKKEMEGMEEDEPMVYQEMKVETPGEQKPEVRSVETVRVKDLDFENLTRRIVSEVSARVAEKIAEKIDAQEIKQMIKEKIEELV